MRVLKKRFMLFVLIPFLLTATPDIATPITLAFSNITANAVGDAAIGEAQLFVDVTAFGSNQVLFTFSNIGPLASSITDVYFDDGSLSSIFNLIDADDGVGGDAGVDFTPLATPGNLPGANMASPAFVTTLGFSADSDPPAQPNGVNPNESLGIIFNLMGGQTFGDILNDLNSEALRIGIHVQGFNSGGSESFVNVPIPEPTTVVLLGVGLFVAGVVGRVRQRRGR